MKIKKIYFKPDYKQNLYLKQDKIDQILKTQINNSIEEKRNNPNKNI